MKLCLEVGELRRELKASHEENSSLKDDVANRDERIATMKKTYIDAKDLLIDKCAESILQSKLSSRCTN